MPTCTTVIKTLFLITVTGLLDTHCANIWTSWSRCSVTCGIRIGEETRICTSVMYGRHACDPRGLVERRDCHVKKARPCPGAVGPFEGVEELKPSEWDTWSQWTPCSVTCGAGNRTRERTCVIKDKRVFTAKCPGAGVDSTPCLLSTCPNTVGEAGKKGGKVTWTDWGLWSPCIGSRTRHRSCPATGRRATCEGSSDEREDCGETCTTVGEGSAPAGEDGWYPWSPWGQCSVTCGDGVKSRERQCQDTDKCQGDTQESSTCESDPCGGYTNGWSNWSPWEQCPVTCGKGVTRRGRDCHNPENIREWCIGQAEETKTCVADQLCPGMTMINEAHVTSRVGARIRCMVDWFIDSHPSATVNWLKDNQYLPMFSGRKLMEYGDLEIDIVEKDDSGIYACSVTKDGVDVITNVVLLKVDEAPFDQNTVYGNGSLNFFSFDVAAPLSLPLLSLTFVIGATIGQYIGNRSNPDADEDPEEASSASRSRKSRQKGGKGKDAGKKKPGKGKKKGKGKKSKKREVEENASDDGSGSGYSEELNREEEVAFAPSYYEDDLYDEGVPYERDWAAPAGDAPPAPPPPGEGPPPPPGPPPGDGGMPPPPPPPPP